jgi:hypothetical protein
MRHVILDVENQGKKYFATSKFAHGEREIRTIGVPFTQVTGFHAITLKILDNSRRSGAINRRRTASSRLNSMAKGTRCATHQDAVEL